jgi:signal transduction histidine kinase
MKAMRSPRTLRSRLFSWFFGAILLAISTSALVVGTTRPEGTSGVEAAARHMAARLAMQWDDRQATAGYVEEIRQVTGFDVQLLRTSHGLPPHVRRVAERGGALAPAGPDHVLVPILRGGELVGALEMNRFGVRPAAWSWWRLALALFAVMTVLSAMAGRVANQLARPLEQLADAADRLGGGDLAVRTDVACAPGWVALEVRDVAIRFNGMAERIEAMVRGQRELLGAISHELRSPLGRARVALEIARDRLPPPPGGEPAANDPRTARGALDDVETQLGAVDRILGDLLDVTRAGLSDLRKETLPVVDWLRARIAEEPTPPAVVLEVDPAAEQVAVPFDPALLARAVHNLLLNARAHGHRDERPIVVRVSLQGGGVRVVVCDTGAGFPAGLAERAFEPFVRGDAARSRPTVGAGYGLGLAIVRRVIEAHGGRAFAGNRRDTEGAEVGFDLPLTPRPR